MSRPVISVTVISVRKLRLPMLPNFILTEDGGKLPIADLTQEQIGELGKKWTEALQRKARDRIAENNRMMNAMLSAQNTSEHSEESK